jgi:hypothetical protein
MIDIFDPVKTLQFIQDEKISVIGRDTVFTGTA